METKEIKVKYIVQYEDETLTEAIKNHSDGFKSLEDALEEAHDIAVIDDTPYVILKIESVYNSR